MVCWHISTPMYARALYLRKCSDDIQNSSILCHVPRALYTMPCAETPVYNAIYYALCWDPCIPCHILGHAPRPLYTICHARRPLVYDAIHYAMRRDPCIPCHILRHAPRPLYTMPHTMPCAETPVYHAIYYAMRRYPCSLNISSAHLLAMVRADSSERADSMELLLTVSHRSACFAYSCAKCCLEKWVPRARCLYSAALLRSSSTSLNQLVEGFSWCSVAVCAARSPAWRAVTGIGVWGDEDV